MRNNKRPMSSHSGHSGGPRKFNRPHHQGGGGGYGGQQNRPRKNYGALREKYMNQARDALASGDRVLAENYFQHADHYYRMMAEENERRVQYQQSQPAQAQNGNQSEGSQSQQQQSEAPYDMSDNSLEELPAAGSLPSFLTQPIPVAAQSSEQPVMVADWEEER